jgi:hypothetical protein
MEKINGTTRIEVDGLMHREVKIADIIRKHLQTKEKTIMREGR